METLFTRTVPTSNYTKNAVVHKLSAFIVATTFSVIGLPGNLLVIILVLRAKKKKSTTTCLLLNLAIADIAFLVGKGISKTALYLIVQSIKNKQRELLLLTLSPKIVANITLAMIALERYNALVKTMKPLLNITKNKILGSVIITWITALLLCLAPTFLPSMPNNNGCIHPIVSPLIIIFGYVLPLLIVVFCYSSILKCLYISRTILAQKVTDEARLREKKRLVRGLVVITFVFLACNLPKIILAYVFKCKKLHVAVLIVQCLSSSINPYLYGLHSENYRNQVKQLFCRKKEEARKCEIIISNTKYDGGKPMRAAVVILSPS